MPKLGSTLLHAPSVRTLLALGLALVALAGCGAAPQAPAAQPQPTTYPAPDAAQAAYPSPQDGAATAAPTEAPLGAAPETPAGSPLPLPELPAGMSFGEIPTELAAGALADLMQRASVLPTAITVVSAEAVEWPDGALGCPMPDRMYPQVISPGFKLVLAANGQEYSYHASEQGAFFLCENPS